MGRKKVTKRDFNVLGKWILEQKYIYYCLSDDLGVKCVTDAEYDVKEREWYAMGAKLGLDKDAIDKEYYCVGFNPNHKWAGPIIRKYEKIIKKNERKQKKKVKRLKWSQWPVWECRYYPKSEKIHRQQFYFKAHDYYEAWVVARLVFPEMTPKVLESRVGIHVCQNSSIAAQITTKHKKGEAPYVKGKTEYYETR